ncbi:hypothetical protein AX17_002828 [Amanita inopinata Kibby_2008]|nr:hypothetical protein AX17_002828 [Amanita inopinata Kibby_2008]
MLLTEDKIPRPPDLKLNRCSSWYLRECMKVDDETFWHFKDVVGHFVKQMLPSVPRSHQSPDQWASFVQSVNAALPELDGYEDNWHISACFSILRKGSQRKRQHLDADTDTTSSRPTVRKRKVLYIGKPPPRRIISANPSTPPGRKNTADLSRASIIYPAACTTCGFCPPVSPTQTKKLRSFFTNAEDLIPTLFYIGILHDRHLSMLLSWTPAYRQAFISALHPDRIKPADKQRLASFLTNNISEAPASNAPGIETTSVTPRRVRVYEPIPKPPLDVELRLIDPRTPLSELKRVMTIVEEEQFQDIVRAIDCLYEEHSENLLADDQRFWVDAYSTIYRQCPVLRLFRESGPVDRNWAIRIYVKRKLQLGIDIQGDQGSGSDMVSRTLSMDVPRPRTPTPDAGPSQKCVLSDSQVPSYPGVSLSTCPVHHPPDLRLVSPRLQHLLESHGSEELLPAFIAAGIKTDQALNVLSLQKERDRLQPFLTEPNLHLTDLQNFTLKMFLDSL